LVAQPAVTGISAPVMNRLRPWQEIRNQTPIPPVALPFQQRFTQAASLRLARAPRFAIALWFDQSRTGLL
jgi:hypothetical protein